MSEHSACPLCESPLPSPFVERHGVPVQQNVLIDAAATARNVVRGELRLAYCSVCDFVTNVAFDEGASAYGQDYENSQVWSPSFEGYVDGLVEQLSRLGLEGRHVVEVGCGNGYFLRKLAERSGCRGTGYDPAYTGPLTDAGGRIRFVRDNYGPAYADDPAQVVICRHVIEHVPSPLALLGAVRATVSDSAETLVVFETPAIEWILGGGVYQDLFYEHCSYFSAISLANAFRLARFYPEYTGRVFGDQYLLLRATPTGESAEIIPGNLGPLLERYVQRESHRIEEIDATLDGLSRQGEVAIWGAGAKGVTFLNLIDPDCTRVGCVVDVNPRKQGMFIPGTGHPIVAPGSLRDRGVRSAIVMNPNYLAETRRIADTEGLTVDLLTDAGARP